MKLLLTIILVAFSCALTAQDFYSRSSGRAIGLAYSTSTLCDAWSPLQNAGGAAFIDQTSVAAGYSNRFLLDNLKLIQLAAIVPLKQGSFTAASSYFGYQDYNRSNFSLGYSRKWNEKYSSGLQFAYHREYVSEGTVNPNFFSFNAGLMAKPLPQLHLGAVYRQAFRNDPITELRPQLRFGARYLVNDEFSIFSELEKTALRNPRLSFALEYQFIEVLSLRSGVATEPFGSYFGLGLNVHQLRIDFGYEYISQPGSNAAISLQYHFE